MLIFLGTVLTAYDGGCYEDSSIASLWLLLSPHEVVLGEDSIWVHVELDPPKVTEVWMYIDEYKFGPYCTDECGVCSEYLRIDPQASLGEHIVTVEAPDFGVEDSGRFEVVEKKSEITLDLSPDVLKPGDDLTITVTIYRPHPEAKEEFML